MRSRVYLAWVAGLLVAGFVGACGGDSPRRQSVESVGESGRADRPHAGAGGIGGAPGGAAGRGSPTALPPPASQLAPGSMCDSLGYCWYSPLPNGDFRTAVAGAGRTDLWIGGEIDLLHFDGGRWSVVPSPLEAVQSSWAASDNDVWFAGSALGSRAAIAHWDGVAMTVPVALDDFSLFTDIWGSSASDVYAVGSQTRHWDGATWTAVPGVIGRVVSGSGPNDVWTGDLGGMFHFDGASWSRVAELEGAWVMSVSAVAPDDVWALVSRSGVRTVDHFDGTRWTVSLQEEVGVFLQAVQASSSRGVWLVGGVDGLRGYLNHFDGRTWTRAPDAPTELLTVRGTQGFGDIAVGINGGMVQLTVAPVPGFTDLRSGPAVDLLATFGTTPTAMWAVGRAGTALLYNGRTVIPVPTGTDVDLRDVWGSARDDVWVVGQGGTVLYFGGLSFEEIASGTTADLNAVFTIRPGDAWIGGNGATLLHWDGTSHTMSPVVVPGVDPSWPILDIHGVAADDIWLSGGVFADDQTLRRGFVSHFDGTSWSPAEVLTLSDAVVSEPIERVWALAANDVWALTRPIRGGVIGYWHFDGTAWTGTRDRETPETFMFPQMSRASFVFGPHDRWIVGGFGRWQRSTD
jgi:hypothetical protein